MNATLERARQLCECGCGQPASIAKRTRRQWGHVRGEPVRFISGHHARGHIVSPETRAKLTGRRPIAATVRFSRFVMPEPNTGCWLWLSQHDEDGYAKFFECRGGEQRAHRFAYKTFVGAIPSGLVLDHLCRNRGCVNPAHLEPVTSAENTRRGLTSRRADQTEQTDEWVERKHVIKLGDSSE